MSQQRFPSLSHWGAFHAVVESGRLLRCDPFPGDTHPSPILQSMPGMVHSPLRIQKPAVREGWLRQRAQSDRAARGSERFVEVDWDTALGLVAEELARVRSAHGGEAIFGGSYGWSSAGGLHHARTLVQRFLHGAGGCVGQVGNYSWGAAQFLLPHVIGTFAPVTGRVTDWRNVLAHTQLFLAFGGLPMRNLQVTSGGAGEHSSAAWIAQAAQAGIEFVVISPTRADMPEGVRGRWIPIRPNTDTALMLAMAHTLVAEGLHDAAFLRTHCTGFDAWKRYLDGAVDGQVKDAAWAAKVCGIDAATIVELARACARQRTMINCTWSLQRAHHGEQPYWASIALAAVLGQIGSPGGGFAFGHGSINGAGTPRPDVAAPRLSAGTNPLRRNIPAARLADMLLHPGEAFEFNGQRDTYPNIRLVYWAGGNPFHHHQDLNRLLRAWQKPETIVVHDSWWTPTARRADIVLPATTTLERDDVGGSSRDRYLIAMKQAIAPVAQSRNDFDIFRELAARLGCESVFTEGRSEAAWVRHLYAQTAVDWERAGCAMPSFEEFWAREQVVLPEPERHMVLMEAFRAQPEQAPLATPSGRIELYSQAIAGFGYDDCPPHPAWLAPHEWLGAPAARRWPLHLISSQPADKLHSQLDAGTLSRAAKVQGRQAVRLHSSEAQSRGIAHGQLVRVHNERGGCLGGAVVDDTVMPGVIVMSTGAWFDGEVGALERHGNPNVLTADLGTSRLTQGCAAMSALVDVEPWIDAAPEVRAYATPVV
ncbi:molybdopterin guanine dinucleotide-containing S/N-oxide reductase [Hylemonella gracilis]|uniref:Biotin sulfoxide reductase n=1 Tax=Hylemonella gracilis ATCC 19624 TaxID=887062 RepID=F3KXU2_9BURK|nr:molybdopterin guanine dinucleotide-containing S/N-oxide reductase [Hylemonella gracilis]EGI75367.1 biotin sulfoxide reductase [Hylemonella gracilis ATCC 19624]